MKSCELPEDELEGRMLLAGITQDSDVFLSPLLDTVTKAPHVFNDRVLSKLDTVDLMMLSRVNKKMQRITEVRKHTTVTDTKEDIFRVPTFVRSVALLIKVGTRERLPLGRAQQSWCSLVFTEHTWMVVFFEEVDKHEHMSVLHVAHDVIIDFDELFWTHFTRKRLRYLIQFIPVFCPVQSHVRTVRSDRAWTASPSRGVLLDGEGTFLHSVSLFSSCPNQPTATTPSSQVIRGRHEPGLKALRSA